ncbi:hypothetical protein BN1708_020668, partial [Verticillium longisporum]
PAATPLAPRPSSPTPGTR